MRPRHGDLRLGPGGQQQLHVARLAELDRDDQRLHHMPQTGVVIMATATGVVIMA